MPTLKYNDSLYWIRDCDGGGGGAAADILMVVCRWIRLNAPCNPHNDMCVRISRQIFTHIAMATTCCAKHAALPGCYQ